MKDNQHLSKDTQLFNIEVRNNSYELVKSIKQEIETELRKVKYSYESNLICIDGDWVSIISYRGLKIGDFKWSRYI